MLTFVGLLRAVAQFCTRWPSQASSTDGDLQIAHKHDNSSCTGGTLPRHEEASCTSRRAEGICTAIALQTITFNADAETNASTGLDAKASCTHEGDGLLQLQAPANSLDIYDSVETEPPLSTLESELTSPGSDLATPGSDDVQRTVAGFRQFLLKLSHANHGTKRKRRPVQLRDQNVPKESRQAPPVHQIRLKPTAGEMLAVSLHTPKLPTGVICMRGPQKEHPGRHGAIQERRVRESAGMHKPCRADAGNSNQHVQEQESALPKGVTAAAKMPARANQKHLQVQERSSIASGGQATGQRFSSLRHPRRPNGSTAKPVVMTRPDRRRGQNSGDSGTPTAPLHLISLMADGDCAQEGAGLAVQPDQGNRFRERKMPVEGNGQAKGQQLVTPRGTGAPTSHQMKCRTSPALQRAVSQAGIVRVHTRQASADPILRRGAKMALAGAGCSSRYGCSKSCDPGSRFSCHTDNIPPIRPLVHKSHRCFTTWSITLAPPLEAYRKGDGPKEATINLIDGKPDICGAALSETGEPAAMWKQLL